MFLKNIKTYFGKCSKDTKNLYKMKKKIIYFPMKVDLTHMVKIIIMIKEKKREMLQMNHMITV